MAKRVHTQTHNVVGAIIEKGGRILLIKEAGTIDKGKWNQPAGWLEVGEDPIHAVKKEVREETGFDYEPEALLGIYSLVKKQRIINEKRIDSHGVKLIFKGKFSGEEGRYDKTEIVETRWFEPKDIYAMDSSTLRDLDIKQEVKDYFAGKSFPLDVITHTVQE